jgi:putative integral membrane protein (TIGR02587 family)
MKPDALVDESSRPVAMWRSELDDAVRGMSSGLLVGVPTVFAVDSWWLGDQLLPLDALILLLFSYLLTLAAVYWINFRKGRRRGWQYAGDAVEALALALVSLAVVFWMLGQIGDDQSITRDLGRFAVTVAPVSLGIAVANHLLPRDASRLDPDTGDASSERGWARAHGWRRTALELAATTAGALFLAMSIVPLDDLREITTEVDLGRLPFVIALSLIVSYAIVFEAGFQGEARRHAAAGPLQHPIVETVMAYLVALGVSWFVLWLFGRVDGRTAPLVVYMKTVLLAFPASLWAAAGRLAV